MRTADIVVVGAGPAGIGAALAAAQNGAGVVVIDENPAPGGHLRWTMVHQSGFDGPLAGLRGYEIAAWASGALTDARVEVLTSSVAWGLFEDSVLGITTTDSSFQLKGSRVIVATGASDLVWPFRGWDLPGVITATAALRLMHRGRVLPGRRVAVLGADPLADEVTHDLCACGANVVSRLPSVGGVTAGGGDVIEWIECADQRTPCDAVVLALGRQPDAHLALQAQVVTMFLDRDGAFVPTRDETLATSVPDIFVVGDAGGIGTPALAFAEGTVAGKAASGGRGLEAALDSLRSAHRGAVSLPKLPDIADSTLVCRCEEVTAREIRTAIADGAVSLNDLKRRTRAGMGICQGIFCNRAMAGMISAEAGIAIESIVPMTARPPARLIPMAAMADLEP